MSDLLKFILNEESIEGKLISSLIELACKERAPEIYKPRKGKVNGNKDKFQQSGLDFMYLHAKQLLQNLGYSHLF
jgi:hypothetical protein